MELSPKIFRFLELGVPTQSGHPSENATGLVPHGPFSTALRAQTGLKHLHIVPHTCTEPMYTCTCDYTPVHIALHMHILL